MLERIPVLATVDVLAIGMGSAGCCAAIAARESGSASVLLVERYGFLGGTSTQMLDTFYGFFTPGETPGNQEKSEHGFLSSEFSPLHSSGVHGFLLIHFRTFPLLGF